ncbi:hypothetical protein QJS04_geneDACA023606 [Acorus gramineus]|uniref:Uncharacterized protein n=1 Tax=Acorus gramineus TaxID=55184 RepID=A0AAV8ZYI2_ACOGR|nr:hypothetical protein QJS04_geneDACA023606 [Acorus gramineus]
MTDSKPLPRMTHQTRFSEIKINMKKETENPLFTDSKSLIKDDLLLTLGIRREDQAKAPPHLARLFI